MPPAVQIRAYNSPRRPSCPTLRKVPSQPQYYLQGASPDCLLEVQRGLHDGQSLLRTGARLIAA